LPNGQIGLANCPAEVVAREILRRAPFLDDEPMRTMEAPPAEPPEPPATRRGWGLRLAVVATVVVTGTLSWLAFVANRGADAIASKDVATTSMHMPASFAATGDSDVEIFTLRLRPGASVGWHSHSITVLISVTKGTASMYEAEGSSCVRKTFHAGETGAEAPGVVHTTRNDTKRDLEYVVFALHPKGSPLSMPQPRPVDCHH
jgi:quercetin dioxygenase-like cupin family protein